MFFFGLFVLFVVVCGLRGFMVGIGNMGMGRGWEFVVKVICYRKYYLLFYFILC